jgi:SagB-type dehydrogenase family enzyme
LHLEQAITMSDPVIHSPAEGAARGAEQPASGAALKVLTPQEVVRAYHQRTKHQLQRFAAGPDTLDWDSQPDPFRQWAGSPLTLLPLAADTLTVPWADLFAPGKLVPQAFSRDSLAALLELSFGLTAWKQFGPDRWALRANPSSGNLHPTEAYVLSEGASALGDGLYHYAPREHALALRASRVFDSAGVVAGQSAQLWIGLSSVQWREAWKYGERAFRYCQLDAGHAVGAVRYAAAALGWQARVVEGLSHAEVAALLGLDRDADFGRSEREEPEMLMQVWLAPSALQASSQEAGWSAQAPRAWADDTVWQGQASRLDAHPMYRWPVIDEVARATRGDMAANVTPADTQSLSPTAACSATEGAAPIWPATTPPDLAAIAQHAPRAQELAATVIRGRRSAQHYDRREVMSAAAFFRLAQALLPQAGLPWDAWPQAPRVHVVLYAHRVEGVAPGAYVLPRSASVMAAMQTAMWSGRPMPSVPGAPEGLPLYGLAEHPALAGTLRTLSCHQAIASDACLAVSLLAEFDGPVGAASSHYRDLFQECGLVGQALYLQAEAEGLRGTGIGCYFDDAVHELLGLKGQHLQVLYQFTVGVPMADTRISTEPAYANRAQVA